MDELTSPVIKGGETRIETVFSRSGRKAGDPADWKGGLRLTVRARPEVEEFIQSLGNGSLVDVGTVGRYWQALDKGSLSAYVIQSIPPQQSDDGCMITLDRLWHPLIIPSEGDRYPIVNLSFLRLRGISDGIGVTFGVKGVYSFGELCQIRDRVTAASRRFYIEYLRPIDLTVTVSTQVVQL